MSILSKQVGLDDLREQTQYFIDDDPTDITLIPKPTGVVQLSGGIDYTGIVTPRATQTFKVIPTAADINVIRETSFGEVYTEEYILVGTYDSIIQIGDHWQDGNTFYRVTAIVAKNDYEIKAVVGAFGVDPNYG